MNLSLHLYSDIPVPEVHSNIDIEIQILLEVMSFILLSNRGSHPPGMCTVHVVTYMLILIILSICSSSVR